MAYVRTVKTASGATAVQIVHGSRRGARDIEHLGSAHDEQAVEVLKAVVRQRLAGGQGELELGVDASTVGVISADPLPIGSSRMALLWEALGAVGALPEIRPGGGSPKRINRSSAWPPPLASKSGRHQLLPASPVGVCAVAPRLNPEG